MAWIKITDNRYGESFRTGINGLLYDIPVQQEVNVEDALADHIKGLGVACEDVAKPKGASASEEGSGGVLAPIAPGTSAVEAPAMKPKSLGSGFGTQPGDVTAGPAPREGEEEPPPPAEDMIEALALTQDTRVKGERRSGRDASVAEIAGEGEQGTTPAVGATRSPSKEAAAQERAAPKNERK